MKDKNLKLGTMGDLLDRKRILFACITLFGKSYAQLSDI